MSRRLGMAVERGAQGVSALRRSLLALFLVALSWQSLVLQLHTHEQPGAAASAWSAEHPDGHHRQAPSPSDDCPICQDIAVAGSYLAPAAPAIPLPVGASPWFSVDRPVAGIDRQQAHHWRSRAPPRLLAPSI
jgi:hypothetical protein